MVLADDDIGGIQAEVTVNLGPLESGLQRAGQLIRNFEGQFGKINVQITTTLPNQQTLRETHQALTRGMAGAGKLEVPIILRAPNEQEIRDAHTAVGQKVAQVAAQQPAQRPTHATPAPIERPAVVTAPAAAEVASPPQLIRASKGAGSPDVYRRADGSVYSVYPSGGGSVGGGGGFSVGGQSLGPGPRPFLGGREFDIPGLQEELGQLRRQNEELRAQLTPGVGGGGGGDGGRRRPPAAGPQPEDDDQIEPRARLSEAQLEQRRAAGRARAASAARGQPGNRGQFASTPAAAQIGRPPIPETLAAETETLAEPEGRIPALAGMSMEQQMFVLNAAQGIVGTPEEQDQARRLVSGFSVQGKGGKKVGALPPLTRLTPSERAEVLQGAQAEVIPEFAERGGFQRSAAETELIRAQQATSSRALGTFLTANIATSAGGAEARELAREARASRTETLRLENDFITARRRELQIEGELKTAQGGRHEELTRQLDEQREKVQSLGEQYAKSAEQTEFLAGAANRASSPLRGIAAGFVGGIAGSLAYGVGITAVTAAFGLWSKVAEQGIEVITGHIGVTQKITAELADQTRAQHGLSSAVVAASFAQAGLSEGVASTIRPYIEQRVAIEAGSKALSEQIDLIHAAVNIQEQQRRGGGIPGISSPTGGFLGTPLFAQPGVIEQLARITPGGQQREAALAGGVLGAGGGILAGAGIGLLAGGPLGALAGILIGGLAGGLGGAAAGSLTGAGRPDLGFAPGGLAGLARGRPAALTNPEVIASLDEVNPKLEAFRLGIQNINEAAERGAPNVNNLARAVTDSTNESDLDRTAKILEGLDVPEDQINNLRQAGFALTNLGSGTFTQQLDRATKFFEAATRGASIPEPQEALENLRTRIIPARIFSALATSQLQQNLIGVQAGISRAANPFLPLGTSIPGGVGATSPFVQRQLGFASGVDALNVQRIEAARVEISQLTAPLGAGFQQGALGSFDRLSNLGQRAAGLQSFITQQTVGLQTAQFDEQIRLQRLQLTDLAQLTGRIGATSGDNLGLYQRQLITLQRQSAELQVHTQQLGLQGEELNQQLATLQLELQQRQINFSVAVAGFTAPGTTPEERAARIDEAEREARFAQRQLDIRKELLQLQRQILRDQRQQVQIQTEAVPLQFKIQDITFDRDYIASRNALNLLTRARSVNINVAGAQEALQRINAEIEVEQARLNEYVQQAAEFQGQLISDQAQFIATYSRSTRRLLETAVDFLDGISTGYSGAINDYLTSVTNNVLVQIDRLGGGGSSGGNIDPVTGRPRQSGPQERADYEGQQGFLGMTQGPTTFLAGEVQGEAVAILKNPRQMLSGGGGGMQINFTIHINNPVVRDEGDIERLTRSVADAVEQRISRRISLQGFRPSLS